MADVRPHPHDVMVHAVLSDVAEATGFPRYEGCHNQMDFPRAVSRIFCRTSSTNWLKGLWHSGRSGG